MIGALLLAVATVTGGYVATYTFDRSAAVYARLATGERIVRAHASSSFARGGWHTKILRRLGVSVAPIAS